MNTTLSITNSRENELQFDVSVEGTDVSEMRVRFVIEADGTNYMFPCKQSDTPEKWIVKIPKMSHLEVGTYDFHVEIITNGYYFDPYKGSIDVTPEPTVSQSDVSKKVPAPVVNDIVVKGDEKEEEEEYSVREELDKEADKKTEELVDTFLRNKKKRETVVEDPKDAAIKSALKEFKKRPVKENAPAPKKRKVEKKALPKRRIVEKKVKVKEDAEPKKSALDLVIEDIGVPKDPQAVQIRNIVNSLNHEEEEK